jgi:glycerate 2-kinase
VAPRDLLRRMFEAAVDAAAPNACVPAHRPAAPAGRTVGVGGGKAAVLVTLLISDVPGDDPSVIGSGPTVPDDTTRADAQAVLARYGIDAPPAVTALGMRARDRLADNDGNTVFQALQNLVTTGPTRTNVNDLRAVLIDS